MSGRASRRIVRGRRLAGESPVWSLVRSRSWFERVSPWAGWTALLLCLVLLLAYGQPKRETPVRQAASVATLAHAKDLGRGMTALLLEQYHARTWSRRHLRVDSTITPEGVQEHLDALGLRQNVRILTETPGYIRRVPYGSVVLQPISEELRTRWEPQVALMYETSTLLHWLAWEHACTLNDFGPFRREMQQAYITSYPKVARELNRRLAELGMSETLQTEGHVDPEGVIERCWEIDQALETDFHLDQ